MVTSATRLRVGIVGGIFGMPAEYRKTVRFTPETVLVEGLAARGIEALPISHFDRFDVADFDVVHVHHLSWGAVRAATSGSRTPMVFTLHQSSTDRPRAARFVLARADAVVALWPEEADRLTARYRLDGAEMRVIPNGIDPIVFPFAHPQPPRQSDPWRILFVGQLIPMKGVDILLDAIARVRQTRHVELSLSYHSASDESRLREQARALGVVEHVHFLGAAPQELLSQRYRDAHIVALPSRSAEALPSAMTEAMMSGRYPVATDVGGVRQQLGPYGVVLDEAAPECVARGIEYAIATFDDHCKRASEMRRVAVERFSIDQMVSEHESLYRGLVESGRTPRRLSGRRRVGTVLLRAPLALRQRDSHPLNPPVERLRSDATPA